MVIFRSRSDLLYLQLKMTLLSSFTLLVGEKIAFKGNFRVHPISRKIPTSIIKTLTISGSRLRANLKKK